MKPIPIVHAACSLPRQYPVFSPEKIKQLLREANASHQGCCPIRGSCRVTLDELFGKSRDDFLELLSEKLTGNPLGVLEIQYWLVGIQEGEPVFYLEGYLNAPILEPETQMFFAG